jgi:hypothetical protein
MTGCKTHVVIEAGDSETLILHAMCLFFSGARGKFNKKMLLNGGN